MQSSLLHLRTTVILSCFVLPAAAFSRGAGPASCQAMSPGHIRVQPQDPQQSYVTIRTSVDSYLPGQLVTVTVRSSRDFMGFLLQARRVEDSEGTARVAGGAGSPPEGPVLVGGSWTLAPPGTHTLRCLSEGDTLTHSDKQLKRNLSFVWRAPDAPVGDIRFYITVVQSYFVYWAGIKSAVVRDGSRSLWTTRNTTGAETGRAVFGLHDETSTPIPAPLNQPSQSIGSASLGKQSFTPKKFWKSTSSPVTLARYQKGRRTKNYSVLQTSRDHSSSNYLDSGSLAEESGGDPYPFITPFPPDEGVSRRYWKGAETTTPSPLTSPENKRLLNTNPSEPTSYKPTRLLNVPTTLFGYKIQSSLQTSQKSLTIHDVRSQSKSSLQSQSNTDMESPSSQTVSNSTTFLPTSLKSTTQSLLQQPLDSRDGPSHPPNSSRQTLFQTSMSQSPQDVSDTLKNLLLSDKAVEGARTRPQPLSKEHPQTVTHNSQPSVSTRRLNTLVFTTKSEHADGSSTTMAKSMTSFDSSGSPQSSPSHNVTKHPTKNHFTPSSSQEQTIPVYSHLPKPSPMSTPPKWISSILSSTYQTMSPTTSTFLSSSSVNSPSSVTFDLHGPFRTSVPGSTNSPSSPTTTRSTTMPSSSLIPSTSHLPLTSVGSLSFILAASPSSHATSPHPGPSPAPRRSLNNRPSISPVPLPSQRQTHIASSNPKEKYNPLTSSHKLHSNIREELKPKPPKPDTKLPLNPLKTPGMEGKYPEIVTRHSSWELGMLLGCSAGLGMALVVGVRYVYRQACGKHTEVTLHDRERDYGRGERGMIHVQECGDLVRVRRIRENSLVLLAEYDILASPGD
ncbi:uncharacterized protein [Syngnathus scovelli]|uniref:uncharacterized protein n=1 Tax=Syngnathus scovelli TaxID=161590 RepID=UPI002110895E|nr:mucin-5AC-like isoform X1 [Syngnathus scovelli]